MPKNYSYLVSAILLFNFQFALSQNTWYVSQNGTGNGTTWALASRNLQDIMDNATPGDQVWIKQGTYQRGAGLSFAIRDGVSVYGGFPATANPTLNDRNPRLYETILSGNHAKVLEAFGVFDPISASTIIDGLTITNGQADYSAGIHINNCDATFRNLKIINNVSAMGFGGGMNIGNSNSVFIQILVANNTSQIIQGSDGDSGGIRIFGGSPKFYNSVIANNHAQGYAGGVSLAQTTAYFANCIIYGNTADIHYTGTSDNFYFGQNVVCNSTNSILEHSRGSDYLFHNPQFQIYGNDLGGNLDVNPMFNADYSLQPGSKGVNKGNTQAYLSVTDSDKDFFNNNRVVDAIDIGLSEYQTPQSEILYVKQNGVGDGSSWANASGDLQQMMDKQLTGKSVYVAEGTYYAPTDYFRLRDKIKIYGGFPATGNPTFDDRNSMAHATILTSIHSTIIGNFHPEDKKISSETLVDGFVVTKNVNSPVNMLGIFDSNSEVTYSDVTFRDLNYGAVKTFDHSNTTYLDCHFLDNQSLDEDYPTVFLHMESRSTFTGCSFSGNQAFIGSAMYLKNNSYARIDSCEFNDNNHNFPSSVGKVVEVENSSALITNSNFDDNGDNAYDGAALSISGFFDTNVPSWTHPVTVTVDRCTFSNNLNRGVLYAGRSTDKVSISNSLFYKNQGGSGGAISKGRDGDFYLTNCTITENYASNQVAGGIYIGEGSGNNYIRNSIIYNNSAIYPYTPEVWIYAPVRFRNTLIRTSGGSANWNGGALNDFDRNPMAIDMGRNIDVNPLFADAANGNYRLTSLSPAINAGDTSLYNTGMTPDLSLFSNDLDSTPRIQNTNVDMGAYEFEQPLSTDPIEMANGISIYPNPAESMVHIHSEYAAVKEVRIYDILGKELMKAKSDEVDLTSLSKGIYVVKITLDTNKAYTLKLVKK